MFEDLRNSDDTSGSFNPGDEIDPEIESMFKKKEAQSGMGFKIRSSNFLGMNAFQRFVISFLLFSMVCVLGVMFLLVSGSISLPF